MSNQSNGNEAAFLPALKTIMTENEFKLRGEFVELCNLLKLAGVADSGGHGKTLVAAGQVRVDGVTEHRKTAKIRAGQTVECQDIRIKVLA